MFSYKPAPDNGNQGMDRDWESSNSVREVREKDKVENKIQYNKN